MRTPALISLCLCSALCAQQEPARDDSSQGDSRLLITRPGLLRSAPRSQLLGRPAHRSVQPETGLRLGDSTLRLHVRGSSLKVGSLPGSPPRKTVRSGQSVAMHYTVGGGRERVMHVGFEREHDRSWSWYCADVRVVTLAGQPIRLVDVDADGRFTLDTDGYLVPGARTVCPLAKRLLLGATEVRILTLADNGAHLRVAERELTASASQRGALRAINGLRAQNGLPGVTIADGLSSACTAHAQYLVANEWAGLTDPHHEQTQAAGYSASGAAAAARSVIMKIAHGTAIPSYWRSWYHRRQLMDPRLQRVGINAEPVDLSVIDVSATERAAEGWNWPVSVPADGAVDVPVQAVDEMPSEPVEELATRGFPILALYAGAAAEGVEFSGSLVSVIKGRVRNVPVLKGAQGRFRELFGIVPERPLRAATDYVATLQWRRGNEVTKRVIRFRTR